MINVITNSSVSYIITVLVAVPTTSSDGTTVHRTHLGLSYYPPTADTTEIGKLLIVRPSSFSRLGDVLVWATWS